VIDTPVIPVESVRFHRYMPHLQKSINLGSRDIAWVDAARHPQLLSYDARETLGRIFKGTTAVLLASRAAIRLDEPEREMQLLFELKKAVSKANMIQAQATMLLANLHSPESRPLLVCLAFRLSK